MKNYNMKNLIYLVILFVSMNSFAQQEPLITQYMYNMSVINPAYATNDIGVINMGGLYRTQWVGAKGAPQTGTFFAHTPLSERVEVGLSFVGDKIGGGAISQNNIFADFAYVLPVSYTAKLSLGIKAGGSFFNRDIANLETTQADPTFFNSSSILPNVGVGAFYFDENYYVGVSSPNLLKSEVASDKNGVVTSQVKSIHYYFTGGYVFELSDALKYKPSFMARVVSSAPLSFDLNNSILINEKFEVGVGYRFGNAVMANAVINITPNLRVGYAYDYTTTIVNKYNSGSHEIMLLFNLDGLKKSLSYDKSPRFY